LFLSLLLRPAISTLFPYTTLFRSQPTAVKLLKSEALVHSPDLLERFKREGEALRQLNHPNIVKMLSAFEDNHQHYIVMEYDDIVDRKSTRLNSSHLGISYAVFCLK